MLGRAAGGPQAMDNLVASIPDLSDDQWRELTARLAVHAAHKMARLYWRGCPPKRGATAAGGVGPDDIAAEAIVRVLDGRRAWPPGADPYEFLRSVVDSLISHLAEQTENTLSRPFPLAGTEPGCNEPLDHAGREPDPFRVVADAEEQRRCRELVLAAVEKDKLAASIFECIECGAATPLEIADLLEVPVTEVYNAQKRLQRAVNGALCTHNAGRNSHARRA